MSLKDYFGNIKTLLVRVHDAELKAELQAALLDAQGEALDLQERVARLQEENLELSEQLRERDERSGIAERLYYARHAYWRKDEEACSAYCPTCWDSDHKLLHLMHVANHAGYCIVCKKAYHYVYDGPRPKEGDTAAPGGSTTSIDPRHGSSGPGRRTW